jgi:REP element-mobilizing transposase RayT
LAKSASGEASYKTDMKHAEKGQHRLRTGRISASGLVYFVTTCIEGRRALLSEENHQQIVHESLGFCETAGWITWYCYTIMPDHLHLLFQLHEVKTLSQFMDSMEKWTSRRINEALRRSPLQRAINQGSRNRALESLPTGASTVWQDGFFDHRIRSQRDFDETVVYIFLNPVEDGLISDPWQWPGWRAKPEIEQWLRRWETEKERLEGWLEAVRKKKDIYE